MSGVSFKASQNDYDWLGHGIYFWESNPVRGFEFARTIGKRQALIENPAVVGAVIDLGRCLDLTTTSGIALVRESYDRYVQIVRRAGKELPSNSKDPDQLLRRLDCAVINALHSFRKDDGEAPIDTVKGVFLEGERIYPGADLFEQTHIQICVRNPYAIKGVFRVMENQFWRQSASPSPASCLNL